MDSRQSFVVRLIFSNGREAVDSISGEQSAPRGGEIEEVMIRSETMTRATAVIKPPRKNNRNNDRFAPATLSEEPKRDEESGGAKAVACFVRLIVVWRVNECTSGSATRKCYRGARQRKERQKERRSSSAMNTLAADCAKRSPRILLQPFSRSTLEH